MSALAACNGTDRWQLQRWASALSRYQAHKQNPWLGPEVSQRQVLPVTLPVPCMQSAAAKMMAGQRAVLGKERPDLRLLQASIIRQMLVLV